MINTRFGAITLLIFLVAMSRLVPHPPGFAPVGGIALFGAAYFTKRYWAFIIPIISMWVSDLILNNAVYKLNEHHGSFVWFYDGSLFTYGAFAFIVLLGMLMLKKVRIPNLVASALGASAIFFIVSNFGVWFSGTMYPKDLSGLAACYAAGIPFFQNTVLGDLFYSAVLFGAFEFAMRRFAQLQLQPIAGE
jgi:hypothetical protein